MTITKKITLISLAIILLAAIMMLFIPDDEQEKPKEDTLPQLKQRYTAYLTDSLSDQDIGSLEKKLNSEGKFSDITYRESAENPRETVQHLERLETMAKAYRTHQDQELKNDIQAGLEYWNSHPVTAGNWWWNKLRIPMLMSNILLLMDGELSTNTEEDSLNLLQKYTEFESPPQHGLNLIQGEKVKYVTGLVREDPVAIKHAVSSIEESLKVSSIGIQPDMTFHQHEQSVQTGTYGIRYALEVSRMFTFVHGTPYSFSSKDYHLLSHFILDGIQWFITGDTFDYTSLGRGITRKDNELQDVISTAKMMETLPTNRSDDFNRLIERLEGKRPPFTGNRAYEKSGLMVHHQKEYYSSVRVLPEEMTSSEPYYNGEGINNRHMADGANLFYLKGNGYAGIFPVWDWRKIPGTTVVHSDDKKEPLSGKNNDTFMFSDGKNGVSAMNMKYQELSAKKSWFFFGDSIVALGADIHSESKHPIVTTIDQRIWNQPVETSETPTLDDSTHKTIDKPSWVYHDGIGYLFPGNNDRIHLMLNKREASWNKINQRYDGEPQVKEKVLSLWINHGYKPKSNRYQYIVVPGATKEEFDEIKSDSPIEILRNDRDVQVVKNKKLQLTEAVYWNADTFKTSDGLLFSMNQAGILQLSRNGDDWSIKAKAAKHSTKKLKVIVRNKERTLIERESKAGSINMKYNAR
ncbi:polysaccharide lyase beta-sandwich domain-containing protein [Rossellomorea aquimaris]|uniref:polysaccharide lyase family 8 super-sandwich domain-containing protein n=1 Tax=Rossellomorea aquimaris TaxID=189382 RepID=UPI001CD3886F|nr:polysaccharide lyase family 8 super-sandwich domain-containing protein [Rossellomorea aquimaris]MCA1060255.1 polysaccharide lyase beta-sandwich domain-containing protein [Rossellomorea aquimaris]